MTEGESITIVNGTQYGDAKKTIHPINKVLQESKTKNKSVLEILVKANHCKIIQPQNWIINPAGSLIHPGQLFMAYDMTPHGNIKCVINPYCQGRSSSTYTTANPLTRPPRKGVMGQIENCHPGLVLSLSKGIEGNLYSICLDRHADQRVFEMFRFAQHDMGLGTMPFALIRPTTRKGGTRRSFPLHCTIGIRGSAGS